MLRRRITVLLMMVFLLAYAGCELYENFVEGVVPPPEMSDHRFFMADMI